MFFWGIYWWVAFIVCASQLHLCFRLYHKQHDTTPISGREEIDARYKVLPSKSQLLLMHRAPTGHSQCCSNANILLNKHSLKLGRRGHLVPSNTTFSHIILRISWWLLALPSDSGMPLQAHLRPFVVDPRLDSQHCPHPTPRQQLYRGALAKSFQWKAQIPQAQTHRQAISHPALPSSSP